MADKILVADASGKSVKLAMLQDGSFADGLTEASQAVESFVDALGKLCGNSFDDITAYALCVGPGSMLSTRSASAAVASIAALTNAKLYAWDTMRVAAFAIIYGFWKGSIDSTTDFCVLAPSRKGFVNVLHIIDSKEYSYTEMPIEDFEKMGIAKNCCVLLDQRAVVDARLDCYVRLDLTPEEIAQTLIANPELLEESTTPPEPKSLVKREYVKWKAQVLI